MNRLKLILAVLNACLLLVSLSACSGSMSSANDSGNANTGDGGGDGDNNGSGDPPATTETVDSKNSQLVGNHLNTLGYFIPSNADKAVIFLHGGGHKEPMEFDMEMKADEADTNFMLTDSAVFWLKLFKVMAVLPQGLTISGYNAWTWDNYVMNSGADDLSFLQELVANIKADPKFSKIKKFYLVGHSNGGMTANRVWCDAPNLFDIRNLFLSVSAHTSACFYGFEKIHMGITSYKAVPCLVFSLLFLSLSWFSNR